eukprot:TRINITY_DN22472_c0_g1_i1.p2 TRINITY_DN22472_c0_g1~~TRINITY_DN22472_c0_g1_i1.p2  ORF type:complete len:132 (-),score=26.94 TRINITY_DN22472_c0_g1_i1:107-502(-)
MDQFFEKRSEPPDSGNSRGLFDVKSNKQATFVLDEDAIHQRHAAVTSADQLYGQYGLTDEVVNSGIVIPHLKSEHRQVNAADVKLEDLSLGNVLPAEDTVEVVGRKELGIESIVVNNPRRSSKLFVTSHPI